MYGTDTSQSRNKGKKKSNEESNETLKWVDAALDVHASIKITSYASGEINVTVFLEQFYSARPEFTELVRAVIVKLRRGEVLNSHSFGVAVGQSLKTASFALWCAGLYFNHASTLCDEAALLQCLGTFDAKTVIFQLEKVFFTRKSHCHNNIKQT